MVDLAIAGIGRWGKNLMREFASISRVKVCLNRTGGRDAGWARSACPGIKAMVDYDRMLKEQIDGVVIATPIETHYDLALRALEAGKHVFVEKPLATSASEAQKLVRLAGRERLTLMSGHVFLYEPSFRKAAGILGGKARYARLCWGKLGTFDEDIVWNLLPHEVALSIKLFGSPSDVSVLSAKGLVSGCDQLTVRLGYPGGRACIIETDRLSASRRKAALFGDGKQVLHMEGGILSRLDGANAYERIYRSRLEPLHLECADFIAAVRGRRTPYSDGRLGLDVVKVLERIEREMGGSS